MRHVSLTVPAAPDGVYRTLVKHAPHRPASLDDFVVLDDGTTLELLRVDGDRDAVEAALESAEALLTAEVFQSAGRVHHVYQHVTEDDALRTILDLLWGHRVIMDLPIRFTGDGVSIRLVGDDAAIQSSFEALPDAVRGDLRIDRLGPAGPDLGAVGSGLTVRQHEVLEAAVDTGYYAFPRTATVDDVAAALDIARSTTSEHLQRIEARVLSNAA